MRGCLYVEARVLKRMRHRVSWSLPLEVTDQARQPLQRFWIEAQGLADLTRSGLAAIRDDVRSHRRAQFSVALIHVLDRLLALLFRGQIEINVRPFSAAFAQESLKEQFHADRINRGDFERVTDGRVCRAPSPLNQDVVRLAEFNDVPNDEEVSGKAELRDQLQLMCDLLLAHVPKALHRASAHNAE